MDGITEFAKMLKKRDNIIYSGPQVGNVVSPLPDIKVMLGDKILLTSEHLVISASVSGANYLMKGDEVILIPSGDNQIYYLMDKVVRI